MRQIRSGTPASRWVLAATVLGSGIVFLDGTVVNIALPAISKSLDAGTSGLQWTIDAYLVTLTALLLLGGSLGDLYGRRRIFIIGLIWFTAASMLCGVAPTITVLIAARAFQGIGGALLVPGSLAIIAASFHRDDRARAVGAWSGLAGVSTAVAPFLGGWLIDAVSWRAVFLINVPVAVVAIAISAKHVPETRDTTAAKRPDWLGAAAVSIALGAGSYSLIESTHGLGVPVVVAAVVAIGALLGFVVIEAKVAHPMLPLDVFRSLQFSGANLTTLAVYSGLGGATFVVVLQLQLVLGYSALQAGAALLPLSVLLLLFSARVGALAQRIGPRIPMTIGPIVAAAGLFWFGRIHAGSPYLTEVFPPAFVFGCGLALTVSPLTATVLAAVDDHRVGIASGVNNAVARGGGLLAVAFLPAIAHLNTNGSAEAFSHGFGLAMGISAALCAGGGLIAFATIRRIAMVTPIPVANVSQPCADAGDPGTMV